MKSHYLRKEKSIWLLYLLLPLLLLAAVLVGSQDIHWLLSTEIGHTVLWQIRIPRALLALMVGALLAWGGVIIQGMVRNPLADPGLIGVSGGAAVGVAMVFWLTGLGVVLPAWAQPVAASAGAWLALTLVLNIGRQHAINSMGFLILAGIAVSVLAGALVNLLSYLATDDALRQISFWTMGSLSAVHAYWLILMLALLLGAAVFWSGKLDALDALLLGEVEARSVGVNVPRLQTQVVLWTAVLTGVAVSACGMIGFVGLVSPHLARLLTGASHRRVLPLAVLLGSSLLLCADMLARTLIAPAEIPIGIITALLGGPVFILLLVRERRHWL